MNCPPDPAEVAEAYLLNRLPASEVAAFEEHYMACDRCAEILEREQELASLIRGAARRANAALPAK